VKDEGEAPVIGVGGSQGVQVGTANVQYNAWPMSAPLDPKPAHRCGSRL
jgi:hypothetical protein